MACIPHRYDKPYLNTKIDSINVFIRQEVKKRVKWHLLEHEVTRDDYEDLLHFNERGKAKYAHSIRQLVKSIKSR